MTDGRWVEVLDTDECWRLLRAWHVGRVAFLDADGAPLVHPVNYAVEDRHVVFCLGDGTTLQALAGGAPASFEIDCVDPVYHAGWSVLAVGRAREVRDESDRRHLLGMHLSSWARDTWDHALRIDVERITGRRIGQVAATKSWPG